MQIGPKTEAALKAYNEIKAIHEESFQRIAAKGREWEASQRETDGLTGDLRDGAPVLDEWRASALRTKTLKAEAFDYHPARYKINSAYSDASKAVRAAFEEEHLGILNGGRG